VLPIIAPIFDMGWSYGYVRSGKSPENVSMVLKKSGNIFSKLHSNSAHISLANIR